MENKALSLPQIEHDILKFWEENAIFEQVVKKHAKDKPFVFYDGPPFATGLPHHGHILQMAIKDAVLRYKTMQGFNVPRKIGWDTHGLPVENLLENELNLTGGKRAIEEYGIENFVTAARNVVLRYTEEWKKTMTRMGRWVDVEDPYTTMDNNYIESVWWAFAELHKKGLIYKDFRVSPYCPHCGTVLSNFEVNLGYKDDVPDISVYVALKMTGNNFSDKYLVFWTTTPWTIPSVTGMAVSADATYVEVADSGKTYVLAKDLAQSVFPEGTLGREFSGSELVGTHFEPAYALVKEDSAYRIVAGEHVTTDNGTGIASLAPMYGEIDAEVGKREDLPGSQHVNPDGTMATDKDLPGAGKFVKTADKDIIADLESRGLLVKQQTIKHTYPFCWRCDTPLLYYPTTSWFVKVTAIKDRLVAENKEINWQPSHLRDGRFGKWLEGARDWAISRDRYWGAPLPVWECTQCDMVHIIGSREDLTTQAADATQIPDDLHRPYIDAVTLTCECGGEVKRVPFVFDCWFESGSMPFAQHHYPFENQDQFGPEGPNYPADFIAEALDQTRGWFYVLHVLGVALWDKKAFKNVDVSGLLLASDGRKLSKKLRNYTEPEVIMEEHGVDALRLFLFTATTLGEDYRFSDEAVQDVKRRWIVPLLNVLQFYKISTHANDMNRDTLLQHKLLDQWMESRIMECQRDVTNAMKPDTDSPYDIVKACRTFGPLVEDLSTWYVRLSRGRKDALFLSNLCEYLEWISELYAPFLPFVTEYIFQEVRPPRKFQASVHLGYQLDEASFGDANAKLGHGRDELLKSMEDVRAVVALGRDLRNQHKLPIKQPLSKLEVKTEQAIDKSLLELIAQELQIQEVVVVDTLTADFAQSTNQNIAIALDTALTNELKAEGVANTLRRTIQDLRKQAGLQPTDAAAAHVTNLADDVKKYLNDQLGKTTLIDAPTHSEAIGEASLGDSDMHITLYRS